MMKRCLSAILCLLLFSMLLTGCEFEKKETAENAEEKKEELKIGLTFDSYVLERWTRERDIFGATAQKLGATVDFQNANGDVEKQRKQIRKFIEDKVDVIVVVAVDCHALSDVVTEARNLGINVISYDRLIQGTVTDLYITVDNEMVGQEMAKIMKEKLPNGGDVVMLCGPEMDSNSIDVVNGFEKGIADSELTVIKKLHVRSWAPENGFAEANGVLSDVDHVDAIMCGNDALAGYAIKALSERQLAGKVVVTGQDADLEACQRIVEGTQIMTLYKPIERLARVAAECAVKMAKGESVVGEEVGRTSTKKTLDGKEVPYWSLPPVAVTKENMDDVIIDLGFHPREEVYLNVE